MLTMLTMLWTGLEDLQKGSGHADNIKVVKGRPDLVLKVISACTHARVGCTRTHSRTHARTHASAGVQRAGVQGA